MKPISFLLGLALLLAAGGCVLSEQPLSAVKDARPDPQLVGQWQMHDKSPTGKNPAKTGPDDGPVKVSFDERGIGHGAVVKDGVVGPESARFFITRTGHHAFLNVQDPASHSQNYRFYKYRVSDDGKSVQLWSLRPDPFDAAIKAGQLKGKLDFEPQGDPSTKGSHTLLQDPSEKILRFIESKPDQEIFEDSMSFEKIN